MPCRRHRRRCRRRVPAAAAAFSTSGAVRFPAPLPAAFAPAGAATLGRLAHARPPPPGAVTAQRGRQVHAPGLARRPGEEADWSPHPKYQAPLCALPCGTVSRRTAASDGGQGCSRGCTHAGVRTGEAVPQGSAQSGAWYFGWGLQSASSPGGGGGARLGRHATVPQHGRLLPSRRRQGLALCTRRRCRRRPAQ